jgi:ferrous iron transport protein A
MFNLQFSKFAMARGSLVMVSPMTPAMIDFSQVRKGMRAKVTRIPSDSPDIKRLQEMGLTVGAEFRVVKIAPLGDPVEIEIRGYRLCLRKRETEGIEVEVLS